MAPWKMVEVGTKHEWSDAKGQGYEQAVERQWKRHMWPVRRMLQKEYALNEVKRDMREDTAQTKLSEKKNRIGKYYMHEKKTM